jgi:hypothetical protein
MEATIIKTTGVCTDTTLRRLNETIFTVVARGDKTGFLTVSIEKSQTITLKFLSNTGEFFDAVNGTSLGQTFITPTTGTHNVFMKVSADTKMSVYNCRNVFAFGGVTLSSNTNSPVLRVETFQLANFYNAFRLRLGINSCFGDINFLAGLPNLISTQFLDGKFNNQLDVVCGVTGNVASLTNKATTTNLEFYNTAVIVDFSLFTTAAYPLLTTLVATGSNLLNFDLVHLANDKIDFLNCDTQATGITYTGTTTAFAGKILKEIYVQGCTLITAQIDNLLIACSGATWQGGKKLYLKGTRTSASDAAVTSLKANGVVVNINGATL